MFKIGIEGLKGFCHGVDIDTYFKPKLRRCELYEGEIFKIEGGGGGGGKKKKEGKQKFFFCLN